MNGSHNLDSLKFELNGVFHTPTKGRHRVNGRSLVIKRPIDQTFVLNILDGEEKISDFKIELKQGKRGIFIREAILYSLPAFNANTFQELVPEKIIVQNKKYDLSINLTEY